jgi:hypothetical protein
MSVFGYATSITCVIGVRAGSLPRVGVRLLPGAGRNAPIDASVIDGSIEVQIAEDLDVVALDREEEHQDRQRERRHQDRVDQ